MKQLYSIVIFLFVLYLPLPDIAFSQTVLLNDAARSELNRRVEERQKILGARYTMLVDRMHALEKTEEKDAMLFLLADLTLADIVDQGEEYHFRAARKAPGARRKMTWGNAIPADLFLHFVLPPRCGNEILDTARTIMQRELFPRIQHLSMREAVLEINHWCHAHVTYQPGDARTSSPLATMRTAYGRCGEESVFTTTALRAVGIPARLCYTPRWAHTDDNHAWVEVWVDSAWHFLGACEPAPDLDDAWFAEPARRAMLTAATVHGRYQNREEVLSLYQHSTRINTLPWYAPTKKIVVYVSNEEGKHCQGCIVDFRVFNYAEFYPIATTVTDSSGHCSIVTGYGDLLIWAHPGDSFDRAHYPALRDDTLRLMPTISYTHGRIPFDYNPPKPVSLPKQKAGEAAACAMRMQANDSIRNVYIRSFIDSTSSVDMAHALGLPPDSTWNALKHSAGNWPEISSFLHSAVHNSSALAFPLLTVVSKKDLRDVTADILLDHLLNAPSFTSSEKDSFDRYIHYVLNPVSVMKNCVHGACLY